MHGSAIEGKYKTSASFRKAGVISGKDLTTEAAITKLMFLLAKELTDIEIKSQLKENLSGEVTI